MNPIGGAQQDHIVVDADGRFRNRLRNFEQHLNSSDEIRFHGNRCLGICASVSMNREPRGSGEFRQLSLQGDRRAAESSQLRQGFVEVFTNTKTQRHVIGRSDDGLQHAEYDGQDQNGDSAFSE